jgi:hypothetical protein
MSPTVSLKGRDHSKDQNVDDRILEWILRKQGWRMWIRFFWLRTETSAGLF